MEMTLAPGELAVMFERELLGGFSPTRVSRLATRIYQQHGLELTPKMDGIILTLMAMEEGPEFELSETEFLSLIKEVKSL